MITKKNLLQLKQNVEEAKTRVSELNGQKTALMKQLKDTWDCKTVDEANEKLLELRANKDKIAKKIQQGIDELEEKLK